MSSQPEHQGDEEQCRRRLAEKNDAFCGKPAAYIVWGQFFDVDQRGPRCVDCAVEQVGFDTLRTPGVAVHRLSQPLAPVLSGEERKRLGRIANGLERFGERGIISSDDAAKEADFLRNLASQEQPVQQGGGEDG